MYLAACADDEVARESPVLRHGLFSHHLLEELRAPRTAEVISPSLYDRVYERVRDHSDGRQNPVFWGDVKGARLPRLTPD
jgi:uncharacterized caspase-like protein